MRFAAATSCPRFAVEEWLVPIPRIHLRVLHFLGVAVPGVRVGVGVVCGVPGLGDVDDDDAVVVGDVGGDGVCCVSHHAGH